MKIRRFKKEDAIEISKIIKKCFLTLDLGKHTKVGINLQIENNSPENLIIRSKKVNYYIAEKDGKPVGICGFDQYKIHTLFIDLDYHKKGIGKKLLLYILKEAKSKGIKKVKTWSTFYAIPFYSKLGFSGSKEIKLPEGKEEIILIEMEKELD
jgi:N-acetylglutamate synthase-like GNAT family acetyltransferase